MSFSVFGDDLFGDEVQKGSDGVLSKTFVFPPFSVLDARSGHWQERKRAWIATGIQSEIGRDDVLTFRGAASETDFMGQMMNSSGGGTSIFDPVICELSYKWFCRPAGMVLDPFCGGSVRGVVAGCLGFDYFGVDLRREQIDSNVEQASILAKSASYLCADSLVAEFVEADFVFSCPPYGDLEVYSDDPRDISNMDYPAFLESYRAIIKRAVSSLNENSFAAFVVGDFRDKKGFLRSFAHDTVLAFGDAGAGFYNEAILVSPAGTLPVRTGKQFEASRKLGRGHQNLLVFCKGDPRVATKKITGAK